MHQTEGAGSLLLNFSFEQGLLGPSTVLYSLANGDVRIYVHSGSVPLRLGQGTVRAVLVSGDGSFGERVSLYFTTV